MSIIYSGSSSDSYEDWNVLEDGVEYTYFTIDENTILSKIPYVFDAGKNVVLPGPNSTPMLYTLVDGGLDTI